MAKEVTFESDNLITVFGDSKTVNAASVSSNLINYVSKNKTIFNKFVLPSSLGVDSNWYSNNIYYIDSFSNQIIKRDIKGNLINKIQLNNPISISVIQPTSRMIFGYEGTKDVGFWVVDSGDQKIYKFTEDFEIEVEIKSVLASVIRSCKDGGCVFYETTSKKIVKYSSSGHLESWFDSSEFTRPFSSNEDIIDIKRDNEDNFWVLRPLFISKIRFSGNKFEEIFTSSFDDIFTETTSTVLIDVDMGFEENEFNESSSSLTTNEEYPEEVFLLNYATTSEIVVLNENGNVVKRNSFNIQNPVALLVTQAAQSNGVYVLSSDAISECGSDLSNGNFSLTDLSVFGSGSESIWTNENNIPCWSTAIQGNSSNKIKIIDGEQSTILPYDGRYFAELQGGNSFGWGIKQTVELKFGKKYELFFAYRARKEITNPPVDRNLIQNGDFSKVNFDSLDGSGNDNNSNEGVLQVDDSFVPNWECAIPDPNSLKSGIEIWKPSAFGTSGYLSYFAGWEAAKGDLFCELQNQGLQNGWGIKQTVQIKTGTFYSLQFYTRARTSPSRDNYYFDGIENFSVLLDWQYINGPKAGTSESSVITSVDIFQNQEPSLENWVHKHFLFSTGDNDSQWDVNITLTFLPDILADGGCLIDDIRFYSVEDPNENGEEAFLVKINNATIKQFAPSSNKYWDSKSIIFTADSFLNSITFEPSALGTEGIFLDGVSLTELQ